MAAGASAVDVVYLTCQLVAVAVLLAFILGSMVFTGGQVQPDASPNWSQAWSWPVFPVPTWLTIVPAAVGALIVVPVAVALTRSDPSRQVGRWGQTFPAVVSPVAFAGLFPAASGSFFASHSFAAALSAFSFAVLTVGVVVSLVEERRTRPPATSDAAPASTRRIAFGIAFTIVCVGFLVLFAWSTIDQWWGLTARDTQQRPAWLVDDEQSIGSAIIITITTAVLLAFTVISVTVVARQLAVRRRSGRSTAPSAPGYH
jgi:ABC-type Fe3+ transport system permease subunit